MVNVESRLLIYAPTGKDGRLLAGVLERAHLECVVCAGYEHVVDELGKGAAALIVADEALTAEFFTRIRPFLEKQQSWSDFPFLVLRNVEHDSPEMRTRYFNLGNTTLLERPVRSVTLVAAAMSALRARKRQYEMREVDHRKDEFLAMLAHELRNPLAPISAASSLLLIPALDQAGKERASEIIARQVQHMAGLIDDLLDVSRVSRGLVTLSEARHDARQIVASAVEQIRPLIDSRQHKLIIRDSGVSAIIFGDHKRLVQIIANLLNNAAKYTPPGGHITLAILVNDSNVSFTVEDDGIGMESDLIERVFDMFSQAKRSSDRSQGGLGIGLAIVKNLVNLHGGTVIADSAGLGKGSLFTVTFPRNTEVVASAALDVSIVMPVNASQKLLIVDDNVDAAFTLGTFLEFAGYTVTVVHTAGAALEHAAAEASEVYLLDLGLPDMDGFNLARRLRELPTAALSLMIAVTGYGQESDRQKSREAGFDHHFVKPIEVPKLLELLNA
jgi:signal transduction histidine kinase